MTSKSQSASGGIRLEPRSKYLSLVLISLQRAIAYRGTTLINLLASLITVAISFYLWQTAFATYGQVGAFSWDEMQTYIVVAYAVNAMLPFYAGQRIMSQIRTGEIAAELLRPVDFLKSQLAMQSGSALIDGGMGATIALALGAFVLHILPPHTATAGALFIISVLLGFIIKFLIGFLVAMLSFWTLNSLGLMWAQNAFVSLFSGALVPVHFFPEWLQTIAHILPFQGIIYTPTAIYLSALQDDALLLAFGHQFLWIFILWGIARLCWNPAIKALKIQGG